jgi:threonine/homoserine/homoserine lactone efflux protein
LPGFIKDTTNILQQTLMLICIYVGIATFVHLLIVTLASSAHRWLENPRHMRTAHKVLSLLLAGVAAWFALTTAESKL